MQALTLPDLTLPSSRSARAVYADTAKDNLSTTMISCYPAIRLLYFRRIIQCLSEMGPWRIFKQSHM